MWGRRGMGFETSQWSGQKVVRKFSYFQPRFLLLFFVAFRRYPVLFIRSITYNSFTVLGCLIKAPFPQDCATGHRYLRSPAFGDLYLAGPISLANYSSSPSLVCSRATSADETHKFKVYVRTVKAIDKDVELTWIYDLHLRMGPKKFYDITEWQLVRFWCFIVLCDFTHVLLCNIFLLLHRMFVAPKEINHHHHHLLNQHLHLNIVWIVRPKGRSL